LDASRKLRVIAGFATFGLAGIAMFLFQLYLFTSRWGISGLLIAVGVAPGAALFPVVFFIFEGFSLFYVGVWVLGFAGGLLGAALSN